MEFNEAKEEFEALLDDSVKLRLRSDVPVADYLSGGIDSSVVAHMTSLRNKKRFKTFSVAFEDKDFDESPYAGLVADQAGIELLRVPVRPGDFPGTLSAMLLAAEEPKCHPPVFPRYLLESAAADAGCRIMLNGRGADELFTGYDIDGGFAELDPGGPPGRVAPTLDALIAIRGLCQSL